MSLSIRTSRLSLDPYRIEDLDPLYRLWTSAEIRQYLFDDERVARKWVAQEIERCQASFSTSGYGQWCLRRRNHDEIIGFAGLRPFRGTDEPQLLYGLDPRWWGHGYATEASTAVIEYAFHELDLPRILASTDEPNEASIAVMGRLGMRPARSRPVAGRATLYFEIRREDWVEIRL